MGLQRLHPGLRDIRGAERLAGRHDRTAKGAHSNRSMVVRVYDGHRTGVELRIAADLSILVQRWGSRRVSEHIQELLALVPDQRAGPGARHHFYGNASGRGSGSAACRRSDCGVRLEGELLDLRLARPVLGFQVVEMVS